MLDSFKRLFAGQAQSADISALDDWVVKKGFALRRVRDGQGCVIEGRLGSQEWRGEWGESQRHYIEGHELRFHAEMGLPKDLLALVLNRSLVEKMERAVFEQFVEGVQTRLGTDTPPEMRWLVMFQKLSGQEMGPLRDRFAALSTVNPWLQAWLAGPLSEVLERAGRKTSAEVPVVMAITKGRLTLRTAMPEPEVETVALWHGVFEQAMREVRRAVDEWTDTPANGPRTRPSAFAASRGEPS